MAELHGGRCGDQKIGNELSTGRKDPFSLPQVWLLTCSPDYRLWRIQISSSVNSTGSIYKSKLRTGPRSP